MSALTGYNVFLIIVTVIVAVLVALTTLYLLVAFAHPEDRNQAWFPKIVVCSSMFIAIITVLMFPLDVANRSACDEKVLFSDCDFTLPMEDMWYAVYIINVILVYIVTPFTLFYYEADSEYTTFQRLRSALFYTICAIAVFALIFGIVYGVGGEIEYDSTLLVSGTIGAASVSDLGAECIAPAGSELQGLACSATLGDPPVVVLSETPTFLVYVVAVASIIGWLLLMVMGGVGLVALPLDMIMRFFARPKKTITKAQYIQEAVAIAARAQTMQAAAVKLKKQEVGEGRTRKTRSACRTLHKELSLLEDDQRELEAQYPQGEDRDAKWVFYVMSFYLSLIGGIVFLVVAVSWVLHIVLYVLIDPPVHPFLNDMFEALDGVFPLFGVAFFALWCFFLLLAAIKGFTKLGLNFVFIQLYPMKLGATLMSSFLVNSALVLLCSTAVVQFCETAFAAYANQTAIQEIFGNEIYELKGIKHVFASNVFIYIMLGFAALTALWVVVRGPNAQKRKKMSLEEIYAI